MAEQVGGGSSQRLTQDGQANVAAQIWGDNNDVRITAPAPASQPPLLLPASGEDDDRFTYAAQRAAFVGREAELEAVRAFVAGDRPLAWWLLGGRAGAGKSRLALEAALAHTQPARAGFLQRADLDFDWRAWQPSAPTLLVVDYAEADPARVGAMIRTLAARAASLPAPVRVLLLARDIDTDAEWLRRFEGRGSERTALMAARHAPPLELPKLGDDALWAVMLAYAPETKLPPRAKALALFRAVDPAGRPLFAAFAADALASDRDIRGWNQTLLVRDVLERDEDRRWRPAAVTAADKNLVALATIAGGFPVAALPELNDSGLEFPAPAAYAPERLRAVVGGDARTAVRPLEPDVLGELFVLEHLAPAHAADTERMQSMYLLSWQGAPEAFVHFTQRAAQDFPDHPTTRALVRPPTHAPNQLPMWSWSASNRVGLATARLQWAEAEEICADLARASAQLPGSIRLRDDVSSGYLNLAVGAADRHAFDVAERARGHLAQLHANHPRESAHAERLAKVTRNFVVDYDVAGRPNDVVRCADTLAHLATARPGHRAVQEQLAAAVGYAVPRLTQAGRLIDAQRIVDVLCDLPLTGLAAEARGQALQDVSPGLAYAYATAQDAPRAAAVYARLRARPALVPDPSRCVVVLARVVAAIVDGYARAGGRDEAGRWWRRIARLATSRPDMPEVATAACMAAASCLTAAAKARDAGAVERWFGLLERFAAPQVAGAGSSPADGYVDLIAAGWTRVRAHMLSGNPDAARTAYIDLRTRADAAGTAASRQDLANAGTDVVGAYAQRGRCSDARALAKDLERRALARADQTGLRLEALKAWFNVMLCHGQARGDVPGARRVYDHLAKLAAPAEAEPQVRRTWAIAGRAMIRLSRTTGLLTYVSGVVPAMRALISRHPDDGELAKELETWL